MKDSPARLRVVAVETSIQRRSMRDTIKMFKCAKCSEETRMDQHMLIQVLRNPCEVNGKLLDGGLWWACARCLTPYYLIRRLREKK